MHTTQTNVRPFDVLRVPFDIVFILFDHCHNPERSLLKYMFYTNAYVSGHRRSPDMILSTFEATFQD